MTKILKEHTNSQLNFQIKSLAQKERELLSEVLEVINEIDQRKMYLEMGFSSMFSYLTEHIGYSAGSAQRRIDGARLLRQIPEVSEKLETGELKLNQISLVQKEIREFEKNKIKKLSREEKIELLNLVQDKTYEQSQKIVAQFLDKPIQEFTKIRTQKDASVRIELTLSKEQFEKLKLAQDLVSHAEPAGDLGKFIEYVSSKIIQQKLGRIKTKHFVASTSEVNRQIFTRSIVENTNTNIVNEQMDLVNKCTEYKDFAIKKVQYMCTDEPKKNSKLKITRNRFSASVKKNVLRTQQCCQYVDPISGKKCGSLKFLQVDHIQPQWALGSHRIDNAQLLCSNHNKFKYRKEAGLQ